MQMLEQPLSKNNDESELIYLYGGAVVLILGFLAGWINQYQIQLSDLLYKKFKKIRNNFEDQGEKLKEIEEINLQREEALHALSRELAVVNAEKEREINELRVQLTALGVTRSEVKRMSKSEHVSVEQSIRYQPEVPVILKSTSIPDIDKSSTSDCDFIADLRSGFRSVSEYFSSFFFKQNREIELTKLKMIHQEVEKVILDDQHDDRSLEAIHQASEAILRHYSVKK